MRKIVSGLALCLLMSPVWAVSAAGSARRSAAAKMMPEPRASASVNQINAMGQLSKTSFSVSNAGMSGGDDTPIIPPSDKPEVPDTPSASDKDNREKEKAACINNNIGVGNTFVWASRYSNLDSYASMIEDVEEPANNTCFVKVEVKSDDSRVNVSDVNAKYFEMGQAITCGAWADEKTLEKRILDAKKSARTWGTVGGVVGGAAVGVGAMELFGNRLIGGAVEGQKALNDDELLYSQLAVLKKNDQFKYNEIMTQIERLKQACDETDWAGTEKPDACSKINYNYLLGLKSM